MAERTTKYHAAGGGRYLRCRAFERTCPYGVRPEEHLSVPEIAAAGGGDLIRKEGVSTVEAVGKGLFVVLSHTGFMRRYDAEGKHLSAAEFSKRLKAE